ncbi:MAG: hypothetical protein C0501_00370 [Isosphaera sp.]|nr:hypothetical protein [Isosphaera sp.]
MSERHPAPEPRLDDETGFLSAVRRDPADDTARLIYADWLDERGDPAGRARSDFLRLELRLAARPERGLNRARWLHELRTLAAGLDPAWLRTVSHPALEACRVAFEFECPRRWDRLTPTADEDRRFCESCRRHVHYCATLDQAREHARRGDCVAVSLALVRRPDDLLPPARGAVTGGPHVTIGSVLAGRLVAPARVADPGPEVADRPPEPPRTPPRRDRGRNRNLQRENWEEQE